MVNGLGRGMVMEFPVLPPEINSVLMYSGAGRARCWRRPRRVMGWLRSWGRRRCRLAGDVGPDGGGVAGAAAAAMAAAARALAQPRLQAQPPGRPQALTSFREQAAIVGAVAVTVS